MSDLVKWLRTCAGGSAASLFAEAADEIERLRKDFDERIKNALLVNEQRLDEIEKLRESLRSIVNKKDWEIEELRLDCLNKDEEIGDLRGLLREAREALNEGDIERYAMRDCIDAALKGEKL
jgi:hypothetical protein